MLPANTYCKSDSIGITCGRIVSYQSDDHTYEIHILAKDDHMFTSNLDDKIYVDERFVVPIEQPYIPKVGDIVQLSAFGRNFYDHRLNCIVLARIDRINHSSISDYLYGEILEASDPTCIGEDIGGFAWWCFQPIATNAMKPNHAFISLFD